MDNFIFELVETYSAELENLTSLSEIQKQQLFHCAKLYFGQEEEFTHIEQLFEEEDERWYQAVHYHVIDVKNQTNIFDFWYYNVDSGTLFVHNTTDYAGIEMIQFYIDLIETNPFNEKYGNDFADILHEAFKKHTKNT